jgi:hypothetical protein
VTRGTTGVNRLRRWDRWLLGTQGHLLRAAAQPLIIDLGYGASAVTSQELHYRANRACPGVAVLGIEIDPARVAAAQRLRVPGLTFEYGGFELPRPGGRPATVIRAANVLRQYAEDEVAPVWRRLTAGLQPDGLIMEGTCGEDGRVASWVALDQTGPVSLTVALRLGGLDWPSVVAQRLPKALIHRNVPGEPIHEFLRDLDRAWQLHRDLGTWGARQRWVASVAAVRGWGWPVLDRPNRWRLGECTVAWSAVAPR